MTALLDSRVVRIVRWLLAQSESRSTAQLANDLGLSERAVRYRLPTVERYLTSCGAEFQVQRGTGLFVDIDGATRKKILADLEDGPAAPQVYTPEEREHLLLDLLLWSYPQTVSLDFLHAELEVSKTSARRDLKRCEPWLESVGISVVRRPGKGIALLGSERRVRRAIVQLYVEAVPIEVLRELIATTFDNAKPMLVRIPAGLRYRLSGLSISESAKALASSGLGDRLQHGDSEVVFTLYLAITESRYLDGQPLGLDPGLFLSLRDHPVAESISALANSLGGAQPIPAEEIAGVTEYLLSLGALADVQPKLGDNGELLDEILEIAAARLHMSLAVDEELRRSLAMHLSRLKVRLEFGLPVHNPLLADVTRRYPDVHVVSGEVVARISVALGKAINDDEVGFITMYLSGAMERSRLKPRKQALVVCPSGMATAWVLVSRLQAEFPHLALVDVQSAKEYDEHDTGPYDVVISTVELLERSAPVVVVSPFLSSSDLKALEVHV